jgi:ABC-type Na+ efflux pump permease subunit
MDEQFITPTTPTPTMPPTENQPLTSAEPISEPPAAQASKKSKKPLLFTLLAIVLIAGAGAGAYYWQHKKVSDQNKQITSLQSQISDLQKTAAANSTTKSTTTTTTTTSIHTTQEAVAFVQKTYDDYLIALNQANSNASNTQPVAQVGLTAVKSDLSTDLYTRAAAVTQATPFSCTQQYVTNKYTASLQSSDKSSAVVAVSISNGSGTSTTGMTATVDLTTLKITSVKCPN